MNISEVIKKGYYDAAVNLMDDELREEIHAEFAPCTDEEFLTEYCKRHAEKFGEEFTIDGGEIVKIEEPRSAQIRGILGISRAEFGRRYNIPIRTLEDWDAGKKNPPEYVMAMLERIVREDKDMLYVLILSTRGHEEIQTIGTLEEMTKREDALRKECRRVDPDGTEIDCYLISEAEAKKRYEASVFYDSLTKEQKEETIIVDGKKYIKAIYEKNHPVD